MPNVEPELTVRWRDITSQSGSQNGQLLKSTISSDMPHTSYWTYLTKLFVYGTYHMGVPKHHAPFDPRNALKSGKNIFLKILGNRKKNDVKN